MINLHDSKIVSMDIHQQLEYQKQRLSSLEAELNSVKTQLQDNRRYTKDLEGDFEHALGQLAQLERRAS